MISAENQATLAYTLILNVVFIKLFYELDRVKEVAVFFVVITIASYFGLMFILSTETMSRLINEKFLDLRQQTFQNFLPLILILSGSPMVVVFDYTFKKIVNMIRLRNGAETDDRYMS